MHYCLGDIASLFHVVLEVGGGEVLATSGDDDVLLTPGDLQVAVLIECSDVPSVEPTVNDGSERGIIVLVVALEDVGALDQDFTVFVSNLELHTWKRAADGAEPVVLN
ncbi:unannotated protein [freshwater metagenome]|uniref:Unannotated protein n=1 Tax=freshwater metagenome TaxID=449393 RepID=A0A6J7ER68_9ZZZZ